MILTSNRREHIDFSTDIICSNIIHEEKNISLLSNKTHICTCIGHTKSLHGVYIVQTKNLYAKLCDRWYTFARVHRSGKLYRSINVCGDRKWQRENHHSYCYSNRFITVREAPLSHQAVNYSRCQSDWGSKGRDFIMIMTRWNRQKPRWRQVWNLDSKLSVTRSIWNSNEIDKTNILNPRCHGDESESHLDSWNHLSSLPDSQKTSSTTNAVGSHVYGLMTTQKHLSVPPQPL